MSDNPLDDLVQGIIGAVVQAAMQPTPKENAYMYSLVLSLLEVAESKDDLDAFADPDIGCDRAFVEALLGKLKAMRTAAQAHMELEKAKEADEPDYDLKNMDPKGSA